MTRSPIGAVFHFSIIKVLGLHKWQDAWNGTNNEEENCKARKNIDLLNDWKNEKTIPSRKDFEDFIDKCLDSISKVEERKGNHAIREDQKEILKNIKITLKETWNWLLNSYVASVRDRTVDTKELDFRELLSGWTLCQTFHSFLFVKLLLQKAFEDENKRPPRETLFDTSVFDIVKLLYQREDDENSEYKRSLMFFNLDKYASENKRNRKYLLDDFKKHPDPKSFFSFIQHAYRNKERFQKNVNFLEMVVTLAIARALDILYSHGLSLLPANLRNDFKEVILSFSESLTFIEKEVSKNELEKESFRNYMNRVKRCFLKYSELLKNSQANKKGSYPHEIKLLQNPRIKDLCMKFSLKTPQELCDYGEKALEIFRKTGELLQQGMFSKDFEKNKRNCGIELEEFRQIQKQLKWNPCFSGIVFLAEARFALLDGKELAIIKKLYEMSVKHSSYRAGGLLTPILKEALGFITLYYWKEIEEKSENKRNKVKCNLNAWLKRHFKQWDLLEMGKEFDHKFVMQRCEKAAMEFEKSISEDLKNKFGFNMSHRHMSSLPNFSLVYIEHARMLLTKYEKRPLRRKNTLLPARETLRGEMQIPAMEFLDCYLATGDEKYLTNAEELIASPDVNLNFITRSGETIITRAFECEAYEIIKKILRRRHVEESVETLRDKVKNREYKEKEIPISKEVLFYNRVKEEGQGHQLSNMFGAEFLNELNSIDKLRNNGKQCGSLLNRGELLFLSNSVALAIAHGRVDILKQLSDFYIDDMSIFDVEGFTPLIFTIFYISLVEDPYRSSKCMMDESSELDEISDEIRKMKESLLKMLENEEISVVLKERFELLKGKIEKTYDCLDYLLSPREKNENKLNHSIVSSGVEVTIDHPWEFLPKYYHTALTFAVKMKHQRIVIELLKTGRCNVNFAVNGGYPPIYFAIKNNDKRMVNLLKEYNADFLHYITAEKCRVYELPMSEEMRQLFPWPDK
jgi:hypothetical protein